MLSCEHGGMTTRFGARGHPGSPVVVGMRACSHAVMRTRRDSTVARQLAEDSIEGAIPATACAGMLACRRANTAARTSAVCAGEAGDHPGDRLACGHAPMPSCEHSDATAHSALGGTAVGGGLWLLAVGREAFGGPGADSGTCPIKGCSIFRKQDGFFDAAYREVPTFGSNADATREIGIPVILPTYAR